MRSAVLVPLVAVTIVALGAGGSLIAYANWTVPGEAVLKGHAVSMPRGVIPDVAETGGRAVVRWSAQEIVPGTRMTSYVITAHSASTPGPPAVTHTVAAGGTAAESVTFAAGEVVGGTWYWTLVPRFGSWAGAQSQQSDRLIFSNRPVKAAGSMVRRASDPGTTTAPTPDDVITEEDQEPANPVREPEPPPSTPQTPAVTAPSPGESPARSALPLAG